MSGHDHRTIPALRACPICSPDAPLVDPQAAPVNDRPVAWAIESLVHFGLIGGAFDTVDEAEAVLERMAAVNPTVPLAATVVGLTAHGDRVAAR